MSRKNFTFDELEWFADSCFTEMIVDEETGEILQEEQFDEKLYEEVEGLFEEKMQGILLGSQNYEARADAIKAKIKMLQTREKAYRNKAAALKDFAQYKLNGDKFETDLVKVSYRKTKNVVEIRDTKLIPQEYKVPAGWRDSKTAIKEALLKGEEIPGAELIAEKVSMSIK